MYYFSTVGDFGILLLSEKTPNWKTEETPHIGVFGPKNTGKKSIVTNSQFSRNGHIPTQLRLREYKNRPAAKQTNYVFKLHRFALCTRSSPPVLHRFFTGIRHKFEHIIIYKFLKESEITIKFGLDCKVDKIILQTKINHCIAYRLYGAIPKILKY